MGDKEETPKEKEERIQGYVTVRSPLTLPDTPDTPCLSTVTHLVPAYSIPIGPWLRDPVETVTVDGLGH